MIQELSASYVLQIESCVRFVSVLMNHMSGGDRKVNHDNSMDC